MDKVTLIADNEALRELVKELEADAARYRHIRGMFGYDGRGMFLPCGSRRGRESLAKETDEAIDAAIRSHTLGE